MKKNLLLIVTLLLSCVCFTACDDDDDKVSGIINTVESKVGGVVLNTIQFTYEKDKLVKVVDGSGTDANIYQFTYAGSDTVIVKCEIGTYFDYEYIYKLENGRAVSVVDEDDEYTIEYNNNRLKQISDGQDTYLYTWDGENIVKLMDGYNEVDFEGEVTKYENKANIDYNALFSIFSDEHFITAAAYAGILGEKSKNFVAPKGENFNISTKDGYITKISATASNGAANSVKVEVILNYK